MSPRASRIRRSASACSPGDLESAPLAHMFPKLEIESRAQLAAEARRGIDIAPEDLWFLDISIGHLRPGGWAS